MLDITGELLLTYPEAVSINSFRFMTGNDWEGRDPYEWVFSGSNDNQTWEVLHDHASFDDPPPIERNAWTGWFKWGTQSEPEPEPELEPRSEEVKSEDDSDSNSDDKPAASGSGHQGHRTYRMCTCAVFDGKTRCGRSPKVLPQKAYTDEELQIGYCEFHLHWATRWGTLKQFHTAKSRMRNAKCYTFFYLAFYIIMFWFYILLIGWGFEWLSFAWDDLTFSARAWAMCFAVAMIISHLASVIFVIRATFYTKPKPLESTMDDYQEGGSKSRKGSDVSGKGNTTKKPWEDLPNAKVYASDVAHGAPTTVYSPKPALPPRQHTMAMTRAGEPSIEQRLSQLEFKIKGLEDSVSACERLIKEASDEMKQALESTARRLKQDLKKAQNDLRRHVSSATATTLKEARQFTALCMKTMNDDLPNQIKSEIQTYLKDQESKEVCELEIAPAAPDDDQQANKSFSLLQRIALLITFLGAGTGVILGLILVRVTDLI